MHYPVLYSTQGLTDAYRNVGAKLSRIPLLPTQHLNEASPSCNPDCEALHHLSLTSYCIRMKLQSPSLETECPNLSKRLTGEKLRCATMLQTEKLTVLLSSTCLCLSPSHQSAPIHAAPGMEPGQAESGPGVQARNLMNPKEGEDFVDILEGLDWDLYMCRRLNERLETLQSSRVMSIE